MPWKQCLFEYFIVGGLFVNKLDEYGEAWVVKFVCNDLVVNFGAEWGEVVSEGDLFGNMVGWLGDYVAGKCEAKPKLIEFTRGGHRGLEEGMLQVGAGWSCSWCR